MAAIPKLACPLGACSVGGYGFGASWQFGQCPQGGPNKKHVGVDLHAKAGESVAAPEAGTIRFIYSAGGTWGNAILIEHVDSAGNKYLTQLMHVDVVAGLKEGDSVTRGQKVATIASIQGPHLHFAVWNGPYAVTARRGALPDVPPTQTCGNDPGFPASFVDPMRFL